MNFRPVSSFTQYQLARTIRSEGLRLQLPPFVVKIHSPIPVVAEGISRLYADYSVAQEDDLFIDFHVSVLPQRPFFRPLCVFEMDGLRPFTPLAYGEAYAFLEWGLNWCVTGYCHTLITIHSAVLERRGRVLIMPAPPGSGKSTLCAALMLNGWRLLSDEMALLDPKTGLITPAPRPVSLKNQSIAVIQKRAPDAVFGPVARDTMKGTVAHMRVSSESLARANEKSLPAWIVFPKYQAESATFPLTRGKAVSLIQLTENSFNHHVHGRPGFEALSNMVDGCDCYDLTYSKLDEALQWFDALPTPA